MVPNLMIGLGIDQIPGGVRGGNQAAPPEPGVHPQAHQEIAELERDIAQLEGILASKAK